MQIDGWKYYNHAAIPTTAPHEEAIIAPINDGSIWKIGGGKTPLLARYTTEFDCGYETNWWYVIKNTPFDKNALKAKRRYEINKGNRNFIVKEITPAEWSEDIYRVAVAAYKTYPKSYRPNIEHNAFILGVKSWKFYKVYGAFSVEDGTLCGYVCLRKEAFYIELCTMKAIPERERLGLNAAMMYRILNEHSEFLKTGGYICDGERSILHETAFQEYLEKYFGFRKAYCQLSIIYNPKYSWGVEIAYRFRKLLNKIDFIPLIRTANALLKMEEINRNQYKR